MVAREHKIVSLFPYQIKRRSNFYFRDHPKNLNPDHPAYDQYWDKFFEKVVEGVWIDDEGTWVYMMPKLFTYVNYPYIPDAARDDIHPTLRDNEWILFTYYLCVEGFSGFALDDEYTCHYLIEKYEKNPDSLDFVELRNIPASAKKKDGSYKKYIDPWTYLTRHYLIDHPCTKPGGLGAALYENNIHNSVVLSSRGVGKSFTTFVGDFLHEFLTSGIKSIAEKHKVNKRLLFAMGAATAPQLNKSLDNIKATYDKMPGKYNFPEKKGKKRSPCMGPFYKKIQGNWETGSEIQHLIKNKNGTVDTQGSTLQMFAITTDKLNIAAGDRFRRIYVEEFGLLENAIDFYGSIRNSIESEGIPVGSAYFMGTGGDIKAIRQPKEMFENPGGYNVYGIPNYWKNLNKKIGLFVSKLYALKNYKDDQGNTMLELAYDHEMKYRAKLLETTDSLSYDLYVMNNAITPDEMLRPGTGSVLPKQEAQQQLNDLDTYDIFKKFAQIGTLTFNPLEKYGVEWKKDLLGKLRPIIDIKIDDQNISTGEFNKDGAIIIYEQPGEFIPPGLYWVIYDPCKKSGDGQSYHSVLVYKYFYSGQEDSMEDTIVAEWIGRKATLNANFEEVIKIAKYFNARIFTETNAPGFVEWCDSNKYYSMLESDAYRLEQEIHGSGTIKRNSYKVGFEMNGRKMTWGLEKLRDWLLEVRETDKNGIPTVRTINTILSKRIMNEIIAHTGKKEENFDHISSLLGLMLLHGKLKGRTPVELQTGEESDEDRFESKLIPNINFDQIQREEERCAFLNY